MATYKVIQDIEAEDKLLGPLTLRQFIYAFVAGVCAFTGYFLIARGAGFLAILLVPPTAVSVFFAFPWSHEQSTEVWALARIRFLFKPRRRIWDQSGIKELVTITVPKRIEQLYTNGLSQSEVRSRLTALATTIDSRGWAIKNAANPYGNSYVAGSNDRLLGISSLPQEVPANGSEVYTDMLDPADNKVAQQFDTLLQQQAQTHHQQLVSSLQQPSVVPPAPQAPQTTLQQTATPPADFWFLNQAQPDNTAPITPVITPGASTQAVTVSAEEEQALVETLRQRAPGPAYEYSHLPTILPLAERERLAKQAAEEKKATQAARMSASTMTETHDAAILNLASNDDLNVATIARQAKKTQASDDEVVISLH
jgi:PrgI family protein